MYDHAHPFVSTFRDYALDVHVPNILIGIGASIEVPLVTIIGRRILRTKSQIANYVLLSSVCRSALDVPFSILLEYTGVRNLMLASLLINVAAAVVGKCIDGVGLLTLYCVLSGISLGGFFLSRHIFVASVSSKRHRGIVMAFLSGLLRWAHVIGPSVTGYIASRTGNVQDAFIFAAASSLLAFFAILTAPLLRRALQPQQPSSTTTTTTPQQRRCYCVTASADVPLLSLRQSQHSSSFTTAATSSTSSMTSAVSHDGGDGDDSSDDGDARAPSSTVTATPSRHEHNDRSSRSHARRARTAASAAVTVDGNNTRQDDADDQGVLVAADVASSAAAAAAMRTAASAIHTTPPPPPQSSMASQRQEQQQQQQRARGKDNSVSRLVAPPLPRQHHDVTVYALWCTVLDSWPVLWRFGLYVIFFGALRANRKLMLVFAGMQVQMTDAQLSYVLSFGFAFDAVLFPLGGVMMDLLGRQYAMMPVALGLAATFVWLPFCATTARVYAASAMFGIADSLGCGVVMTLTADRAPTMHGGPFFGIIRTLEDLGHVVGAGLVSLLLRTVGFRYCSWLLTVMGVCTALWGVYGVPRDTTPLETPRLDAALQHAAVTAVDDVQPQSTQSPLQPSSSYTKAGTRAYGTLL